MPALPGRVAFLVVGSMGGTPGGRVHSKALWASGQEVCRPLVSWSHPVGTWIWLRA